MAVLGIDWGTKHIGLAVSYAGVYARELTVIRNDRSVLEAIGKIISEHGVNTLVIGLPKNADGTNALIAAKVKMFAKRLTSSTALKMHFENEFLTSKEAERQLAGEVPVTDLRIDSYAAKLILEQYFAHHSI